MVQVFGFLSRSLCPSWCIYTYNGLGLIPLFGSFWFGCHLRLLGSNPFSLEPRRISSWNITWVSKWGHLRYLMEFLIKHGMEVGFRILRQPILACLVFLFSVAVSFRRSAQNSFPPRPSCVVHGSASHHSHFGRWASLAPCSRWPHQSLGCLCWRCYFYIFLLILSPSAGPLTLMHA